MQPRGIVGYLSPWGLEPETFTDPLEISRNLEVPATVPGAYGSRSFTYAAPQIWNSLPIDLKMSPSIENFRVGLKTHLFKLAYPD